MGKEGALVLVESEPVERERIASELARLGFAVFSCENAAEALRFLGMVPLGRVHYLWVASELSDAAGTDFLWHAFDTCHRFTRIVLTVGCAEKGDGMRDAKGPCSRLVCLEQPVAIDAVLEAVS